MCAQVPRAKRPVRAPETTPASSLGRCSAAPRSSSPSSSGAGAGAGASATSIVARRGLRETRWQASPRSGAAFIFGVLVGVAGKGGELKARGSPGEEGEVESPDKRAKGFGFSGRLVKSYVVRSLLFQSSWFARGFSLILFVPQRLVFGERFLHGRI